jgi:hypothetical protein
VITAYILDLVGILVCCRFVFLEDCQHTIEAKGLEQWLSSSDDIKDTEITVKVSWMINYTL